jgi:hypothetical protein
MQRIALVLVLLAGCGTVPPALGGDGGVSPADGFVSDGGADAEVLDDASEPSADTWRPAPGSCNPDRMPDAISHSDCRSLRDRPICDAISERCVGLPNDYCGACRNDADCAAFDHNARCVFLPGDGPVNNDSACLIPCSDNLDCEFLRDDPLWSAVQCYVLPAGAFCVPYTVVSPHCRNSSGDRI